MASEKETAKEIARSHEAYGEMLRLQRDQNQLLATQLEQHGAGVGATIDAVGRVQGQGRAAASPVVVASDNGTRDPAYAYRSGVHNAIAARYGTP